MKFFGFPLKKTGAFYTARIGEGMDVWYVVVDEVPGGHARHGSEQEYPPTWTAKVDSHTQSFVSRGHTEAVMAVRGLEREVRSAVERLGKLTRGPKPGPVGGEG